MPRILIVDDEADMRWLLAEVLRAQGYEVVAAEDGQAALERVLEDTPSAILLDLRMPRLSGMEALKKIKAIDSQVPVIILTAYGDIPTAVQAMRLGAYDYLTKPFRNDDILFSIRRALERQELLARVEDLRSQLGEGGSLRGLMGTSPQIQKVFQQIHQVAWTDFTVILQGETGTGKEIVARAIHQQSPRCEKPFVALDCGAIPDTLIESELFGYEKGAFTGADRRKEGHFELASGGTLFLDEIANLPLPTQSKLLRVLQERRVQPLGAKQAMGVDVRIIVASNAALEDEMRAGRFRQDLYYRLNEFTITIPPSGSEGRISSTWPNAFWKRPAWNSKSLFTAFRRRRSSSSSVTLGRAMPGRSRTSSVRPPYCAVISSGRSTSRPWVAPPSMPRRSPTSLCPRAAPSDRSVRGPPRRWSVRSSARSSGRRRETRVRRRRSSTLTTRPSSPR